MSEGLAQAPSGYQGSIEKVTRPVSYMVRLHNNRLARRHQDHVRKLKVPDPNETNELANETNELDNEFDNDATDVDTFADLDLFHDTVDTPLTGGPETPSSGDAPQTPDQVP